MWVIKKKEKSAKQLSRVKGLNRYFCRSIREWSRDRQLRERDLNAFVEWAKIGEIQSDFLVTRFRDAETTASQTLFRGSKAQFCTAKFENFTPRHEREGMGLSRWTGIGDIDESRLWQALVSFSADCICPWSWEITLARDSSTKNRFFLSSPSF